jgi:uncharacterized protein HemX
MNLDEKASGVSGTGDELSPDLELAIREFRLSVHAWSEAAMNRPRQALAAAPRRQVWRLAAGWALSGVLVVGGVSAGVYAHHQQQAKVVHERVVEAPRRLAEQETKQETKQDQPQARHEDEDLLAKVDSDVSRAVPNAMEPLAQLMATDESQ